MKRVPIPWTTRDGASGTVTRELPQTVAEAVSEYGERDVLHMLWQQLAVKFRAEGKREAGVTGNGEKAPATRASWMRELDL